MGIRVQGAHTLSSDPRWRHVDQSRVFIFLQESIKRIALDFAFRPNTAIERTALRARIQSFLNMQYINSLLSADESSYVNCDLDKECILCEMGVVLQGSNDLKVIAFEIDLFSEASY
jgi:phage tail sheath protein FI